MNSTNEQEYYNKYHEQDYDNDQNQNNQLLYNNIYPKSEFELKSKKDRTILIVLSFLPFVTALLTPFGLDRLYAGRYGIGLLKLFFPYFGIAGVILSSIIGVYTSGEYANQYNIYGIILLVVGIILLVASFVWVIVDIFLAALGKQKDGKGKFITED